MTTVAKKAIRWATLGAGVLLAARTMMRSQRKISLSGCTVLVTGGSRGLGLELARQLVDAGANVTVCARHRNELQRARRILKRRAKAAGQRVKILALPCDVTDRQQVRRLVKQVQKSIGTIDVLINNAGIIQVGPQAVMDISEYEEAMNTHYWGPLYLMEEVLPGMRERQAGRIVNIASIGGKVSVPHLLPYSASKHALVGLSEGYRSELLKEDVYVTTVCPGLIRTGSPKNAIFKGQHRDEQTWFTISDSLPFTSMSVVEAARAILEACRYGSSTVVLSFPAKVLAGIHGVLPGLVSDGLGIVNRWLPSSGGIGTARATGRESQSRWSPSFLTRSTEKAADDNNQ